MLGTYLEGVNANRGLQGVFEIGKAQHDPKFLISVHSFLLFVPFQIIRQLDVLGLVEHRLQQFTLFGLGLSCG